MAENPKPNTNRRKVLVVEPDVDRRQRLYDLLTGHGCLVQAVRSEHTALDALEHDWSDLILITANPQEPEDVIVDLAKQIRHLHDDIPIILIGPRASQATEVAIQAHLPPEVTDEALLKEVDRWMSLPAGPPQKLRCSVMVVDNEPKLREILKRFLEMHNFQVTTAASGEEALEMLKSAVPMFVLLDIGMPGMDGLVVLKKIKAMEVPTTVIMITGIDDEQTMQDAYNLGARDFINKPFSPAYLESVLLSKLYTG